MSYALEKLSLAIDDLAIGEGDIKSRLRSVFPLLSAVSVGEFPDDLKSEWESIIHRLTKKNSINKGTEYDEGDFEATIFRMHKSTAVKIAKDILEIQSRLEDYVADGWSK